LASRPFFERNRNNLHEALQQNELKSLLNHAKPDTSQSGNNLVNKEGLSACVVGILAGYFKSYSVDGRRVEIAADARFIKGIPWWANAPGKVGAGISPGAITLGLYNIHYDSSSINLQNPSWTDLETIVEELQHGVQFIEMWQNMPDVPAQTVPRTQGVGREAIRRTIPAHRPDYGEAQTQWGLIYANAVIDAFKKGQATYDNQIEREAKARRDQIITDLQTKYVAKYARGEKLCP
jgi:hypothetical protein